MLSIYYLYLIGFLALGLLSYEEKLMVLSKFLFFSILDFFSFNYFLKSTNTFAYKDSKKGLYLLNLCIIIHLLLHLAKFLAFFYLKSKISFLICTNFKMSDHSEYYELFYIILLFYFYNIGYSYTLQLSYGNDALVDGQNFDKYIENFDINNSEIRSKNSNESRSDRREENNLHNNRNVNINMRNLKRNYIHSDNSDIFS